MGVFDEGAEASLASLEGLVDVDLSQAGTLDRSRVAERVASKAGLPVRPVILVSPCWRPGEQGSTAASEFSTDVFLEAIVAAGGMPVTMPITSDESLIEAYVHMSDGVAVPGGYGPDPTLWGEEPSADKGLSDPRDALEVPLIRATLAADKPLLCVCRGEQLLNHVLGGRVSRDLLSVPCPLSSHWEHWGAHWQPIHEVRIEPDTLLARCTGGASVMRVNSNHRQCVLGAAEGTRVSARATDGIIEAIELPDARFCLGVQWHPEYTWATCSGDAGIWRAFVRAAAGV